MARRVLNHTLVDHELRSLCEGPHAALAYTQYNLSIYTVYHKLLSLCEGLHAALVSTDTPHLSCILSLAACYLLAHGTSGFIGVEAVLVVVALVRIAVDHVVVILRRRRKLVLFVYSVYKNGCRRRKLVLCGVFMNTYVYDESWCWCCVEDL